MVPELAPAAASGAEVLRGLCGGAVHLPGDPAFDEVRWPWNLQVDARPAAVAYPAFPSEAADVVRAAASVGLRVAPQGTGHGAPPLAGRLEDAVLLRTSAMTELQIDSERRTARVGAGVRWGDVADRAGRWDLAALHTSSPSVGVVGSSIGGGLSWYARHSGLQCSAITAVELVLADGTFVRATEGQDSHLLWAARGGGGGFGVVTTLEFDLLPVPQVYAGVLAWDWSHAHRVLRAWGSGPPARPRASRASPGCSRCPTRRGCRSTSAGGVWWWSTRSPSESRLRPRQPSRRCARWARRSTPSTMCPPHRSRDCTWTPRLPPRSTPAASWSTVCPRVRSMRWSTRPGPTRDRSCCSSSCASSGERWRDRLPEEARWTAWTAPSSSSVWASTPAPVGRPCARTHTGCWVRCTRGRPGSTYLLMEDGEVDERRAWPVASWQRLADVRAAVDPHALFVPPYRAAGES